MKHITIASYLIIATLAMGSYSFTAFAQEQDQLSARQKAALIYRRLAGVKVSIDDARIIQMESLIESGNLMGAADIAVQEDGFYNITVNHMAAKMSTREESVAAPLNDFMATVVGVTRDEINAKELLSGNFTYQANPAQLANVPMNEVDDIIRSNRHYDFLRTQRANLKTVLVKVDGQKTLNSSGAAVARPDAAGLLTSRAFMEAHATAGTNRRLVEYTFREFLCIPIQQWADATRADNFVGRDVDRYPGGSNNKYQTNCKACHSGMDSLRNAFAQVDFANNYAKHGQVLPNGGGGNQMRQSPTTISSKMNQNNDVFSDGFTSTNTNWVNYATNGPNASYFGWRGPLSGSGIKSFGEMVANSKGFSRCMVKRVYESVCKRPTSVFEDEMVRNVAAEFEGRDYNLKWLFKRVTVDPTCLGKS